MKSVHELFEMKDKIAVVTGATGGLGYDIATALAEYGCKIVITSRELQKATDAAYRLEAQTGAEVIGLELDQRDYTSCAALMDRVMEKFGRIDVLVNNAGGGSGAGECNFLLRDPKNIQNMIDTNLTGALFCSQAACRFMAEQGSGTIINLGSIAGIVGRNRDMYHEANKMEQPVEYAAAKGGVIAMTRDLAAFMAPYGVTVNCISPGGFDKGELPQAFIDGYSKRTPMKRMGRMQSDLLGTVVFLASEAASYVTGQNIVVDGGFSTCK
jgi:gluconate 5-dehydrogenase